MKTTIPIEVTLEINGSQLADWWWELDNGEQARFFKRLEQIRHEKPGDFDMQMIYVAEAAAKVFPVDSPAELLGQS